MAMAFRTQIYPLIHHSTALAEANLTFTRTRHSEQIESDIKGEKNELEEAKAGIAGLHKELARLSDQVATAEVCELLGRLGLFKLLTSAFGVGATSQSRGKTPGGDGYTQPI